MEQGQKETKPNPSVDWNNIPQMIVDLYDQLFCQKSPYSTSGLS